MGDYKNCTPSPIMFLQKEAITTEEILTVAMAINKCNMKKTSVDTLRITISWSHDF